MAKITLRPAHPERICWGCDRYCPEDDLACGNGSIRTPHPCEIFGGDWVEWERASHPTADVDKGHSDDECRIRRSGDETC